MRTLLLSVSILVALAGAVAAQNDAVASVIRKQIDAFRADDFATAFTFASPGIRQMFMTPENFGAMVRNGYPMVYRPKDLRFLDQREENGARYQSVEITDLSGARYYLEYEMVETPYGWQINGVRFIRPPDVGT